MHGQGEEEHRRFDHVGRRQADDPQGCRRRGGDGLGPSGGADAALYVLRAGAHVQKMCDGALSHQHQESREVARGVRCGRGSDGGAQLRPIRGRWGGGAFRPWARPGGNPARHRRGHDHGLQGARRGEAQTHCGRDRRGRGWQERAATGQGRGRGVHGGLQLPHARIVVHVARAPGAKGAVGRGGHHPARRGPRRRGDDAPHAHGAWIRTPSACACIRRAYRWPTAGAAP